MTLHMTEFELESLQRRNPAISVHGAKQSLAERAAASAASAKQPATVKPAPRREEDVQAETIKALTADGYRVLQTSRRYRPCPNCGKIDHRGDGATQGVPDLIVCRDNWPLAVMAGIEMKGAKTAVSEAQEQLAAAGRIVIVRSYEDALAAADRVDQVMQAISVIARRD